MQTLTEQLNKFKPASEHAVGVLQEKLSDQVQQRFDAQGDRIDKLSETVLEGQKATQTNVDTLNSLLVGIENLGENFKKMQEDMVAWQTGYHEAEREYNEMNEQLTSGSSPLSTGREQARRCSKSPSSIYPLSKYLPVHSSHCIKYTAISCTSWSRYGCKYTDQMG